MSDDNRPGIAAVTDLESFRRKKPDLVFECSCGSQYFYLVYNDSYLGQIQCRECTAFLDGKVWGTRA